MSKAKSEKPSKTESEKHFKALAEKWASAFIAREKVNEFSGGLISSGYISNLDSRGEGPETIKIGRKICYPVGPFIEWLKSRVESI